MKLMGMFSLLLSLSMLPGCVLMHDARDVFDVSGAVRVKGENAALSILFSDADRRHVSNYYKGRKQKKTPHGLAKRDRLPPGLAKQVAVNGQLPPGLQGRGLPGDLERQLSPLPEGYVRLMVDKSIVLLNQKTGIVVDLMADVIL